MARVPYGGVPEESPSLQAPEDYQREQATPESFGAQIGEGAEAAGQGVIKASDFYGQVAADNGVNNFLQTRAKILYGDPSKGLAVDPATGQPALGPNGEPTYDGGFFGLRGAAAMEAAPNVQQELQSAIADTRSGLTTPLSRLQFDTESRRYYAQTLGDIGQHTDQQAKVWAQSTYDNGVALAQSDLAQNPTDPKTITDATNRIVSALSNKAQINGEDPAGATLHGHQIAADTQVRSLLLSDPVKANAAFEANKGLLASTPGFYQLGQEVRSRYFASQETPLVDGLVSDALAGAHTAAQGASAAGAPGAPTSFLSAVGGRETDHMAGAATAANPRSSARGTDQFISGTWYDPNHPERSVMGQPQFAADIAGKTPAEIQAMRTDASPAGQALQGRATLAYAGMNAPVLQADGVPVNAATLGMAHGFGAAGASALFHADPNTPVSTVLPHIMRANPKLANETAGQVVQQFNTRFGTGAVDTATGAIAGAAPGGATPGANASTADYLRSNMPTLLANAQTAAEQKFPNDPDEQARVVANTERRLTQTITQQDQQYLVDTHTVQSVFAGHSPPKTEADLEAASPAVASAWARLQIENPYAAMSIQNRFQADDRGRATSFGSQAKDYLDRVLAPHADPTRISNPVQLGSFVGPGDDAPLTNTGQDAFSDIMSARGGPQGEAFAAQAKAFIDNAHAELTFSNPSLGRQDMQGEALYGKFLTQAVPALVRAQKAGTLGDALNPKSPNYLGNMMQPYMRTPSQILKNQLGDTVEGKAYAGLDPASQGRYLLKTAVTQGRLSQAEAATIGEERGWFAKAPASPPPGTVPPGHVGPDGLNLFPAKPPRQ